MRKPSVLKKGDRIAIVSLSSGLLGEDYCQHQLDLGIKRLETMGLIPVYMDHALMGIEELANHPDYRAADLKQAFMDDSIKGVICAIGGDDTFRLTEYLIHDEEFLKAVKTHPKLFTGFSDSTNNHLLLYKLGMVSFYGPNFLSDLAELDVDMVPYTRASFERFFQNYETYSLLSSPVWYEERSDFSKNALGTSRQSHRETKGIECLYGTNVVEGVLLGGCLESLCDGYTGERYPHQKEVYESFDLMPNKDEWVGKILFIETSEETPTPDQFYRYLFHLETHFVWEGIVGLIVGKPQNETYYDEYKTILTDFSKRYCVPTLYNVNFGHSYPRGIVPYGLKAQLNLDNKTITVIEPFFQ